MTHKFSLLLTVGAALLLAPLTAAQAQHSGSRYAGGGVRGYHGGYYGNHRGYYGGHRGGRYYYRGSYYFYDPFVFGGFGYPYYYGGFGPGYGVGYYGYGDGGPYYGGGPERVYNGRILSERGNNDGRRGGSDREDEGGQYSPNSMARAVQSELKERGYYRGSVDGQFGAGTASALRKFQAEKGLKVTGRLDERTLKALGFDER